MLSADPRGADMMMMEVGDRLRSALSYLLSEVIGDPKTAAQIPATPAACALQNLMREAAVTDDVQEIRRLYSENRHVLARPKSIGPMHVVSWGSAEFTSSEWHLLQSAFGDDVGLTTMLRAPDAQAVQRVEEAIALLREVLSLELPLWWAEVENLVQLIVLARGNETGSQFSGASAFAAWGAILINPDSSPTPLSLALTLVHESSHQKLFYAFLDDEVVLNDPHSLYTSPLRRQERPMNGIFHATYVLARMISFLSELAASSAWERALGAGAKAEILDRMSDYITIFEGSHAVIETHGKLTPTGAEIMAEAIAVVARCKSSGQAV